MRVAYITIADPADQYAWSGINHAIARSLAAQGVEIVPIGPLKSPRVFLGKALGLLSRLLPRRRYLWSVDPNLLRAYARQAERLLEGSTYDLAFSPGSQVVAYLRTSRPLGFWTDAPFAAMRNYYAWYTNVSESSLRHGQEVDDRALRRCAFACYSSEWAAEKAIRGHHADPAKVKVLPFGANLASDITEGDVPALAQARLQAPWRLLFVGVDWTRKGGDLVLATTRLLRERGYPVELSIVGCQPPPRIGPLPAWVRLEGFVSQHTPEGRQRLAALFRSALFFFMPSEAEAYGIVFCEANSYAVPCLSRATGGVTSIIENGVNGQLFAADESAEAYADFIVSIASEPNRYARMAADSLRIFRERLNWSVSAAGLIDVFKTAVGKNGSAKVEQKDRGLVGVGTGDDDCSGGPSIARERPLRLGFVADDYVDPTRIGAWSGLPHHVWHAMQRHNVQLRLILLHSRWRRAWCVAKFCVIRLLTGRRYLRDRDPALLRSHARQIEAAVRTEEFDFLFSPATTPFAYVKTEVPIAFWVDASFFGMNDFYASFTRLHAGSLREGCAADQGALDRAALAIYSSQWAVESVRRGYKIDPDRLKLIRFGANLENVPTTAEVHAMIRRRGRQVCRLLLIGVDWQRKGVDIAVDVLKELDRLGIEARLTIIGCLPPRRANLPEQVEVLGFVSKTNEAGRRVIDRYLRESHFFILPSRAEAYGLVFCEASAFGLPCIAADVGGVGSIVENGVNGWLLPVEAPAAAYAERLHALWHDAATYETTARNGRRLFEERLNWDVATGELVRMMRGVLAGREPKMQKTPNV